mmetsp:Transcript_14304/g.46982  ORF Transcript_14304/g.46982 Transcript_14304/m.46982 type:complete len:260 (+) Transcript_14304:1-780(+)
MQAAARRALAGGGVRARSERRGWRGAHAAGARRSRRAAATETEAATGVEAAKEELFAALEGQERGIFGLTSEKRREIEELVEAVVAYNPLPEPTARLEEVAGDWRLLYTTVTIRGRKKTRLGLRSLVELGEFYQHIDLASSTSLNVVCFSVAGLGSLKGSLTLEAKFSVASPTRVDISLVRSELEPEQLQSVFEENYDLLLEIFNPEGWLEICYVDESLRVGRDSSGHLFVLERAEDGAACPLEAVSAGRSEAVDHPNE